MPWRRGRNGERQVDEMHRDRGWEEDRGNSKTCGGREEERVSREAGEGRKRAESRNNPRAAFTALLLAGTLVFSMASCGTGKEPGDSPAQSGPGGNSSGPEGSLAVTDETDGRVAVASWEDSNIPLCLGPQLVGDTLYYMTGKWDAADGGYLEATICRKKKDGEDEILADLGSQGTKLLLYLADEAGNLYYLRSEAVEGSRDSKLFLTKLSPSGETVYETLAVCPENGDSLTGEAFGRLGTAFTGEAESDGRLVLANMEGDLFLFDAQGSLSRAGRGMWDEASYSALEYGFVNGGEEGIYAYHVAGSEISLRQVDLNSCSLAEEKTVRISSQSVTAIKLYSGYDRGIYILDSDKMWLYRPGGKELAAVLSWTDGNVNLKGYSIDALGVLAEEALYLMVHRGGERTASLLQIDFGDSGEIPEKQTVTLSASTFWEELPKLVGEFNRQSEAYQVEITPLETQEDIVAFYNAALKGETSDLISLDYVDIPNMAYSGFLEDLTPYFAESGLVGENDILPSVREAWTIDGKICCVFPNFAIRGLLVKKGTTDQGVWTPDEYVALGEAHPQSIMTQNDPLYYYNEVFYQAFYGDIDSYIDWQAGTCDFNNEAFISLVERVKELPPPEIVRESITTSDGKTWEVPSTVIGMDENDFYDGLLLTKMCYISGLVGYEQTLEYGDYAEIAGYPTNKGEPLFEIETRNALAISSTSGQKEGAWAFLEFILSQKQQDSLTTFPVRRNSFETYLKRKEFYGGWEKVDFTQEELDDLREMTEHLFWRRVYVGGEILPIITEELEAVWAGDKSAASAADVIQSRVGIFLSERH